jgi:hypothetical protein
MRIPLLLSLTCQLAMVRLITAQVPIVAVRQFVLHITANDTSSRLILIREGAASRASNANRLSDTSVVTSPVTILVDATQGRMEVAGTSLDAIVHVVASTTKPETDTLAQATGRVVVLTWAEGEPQLTSAPRRSRQAP